MSAGLAIGRICPIGSQPAIALIESIGGLPVDAARLIREPGRRSPAIFYRQSRRHALIEHGAGVNQERLRITDRFGLLEPLHGYLFIEL